MKARSSVQRSIYSSAVLLLMAILAMPAGAADRMTAPFGDLVGPAISNYNRATPEIGSAGILKEGGVAEAKTLGFKTILDLRTAEEGADAERVLAASVGIAYLNLAVANHAPTPEQVATFGRIVEDSANLPILVHCSSANRVGAIWALYRASRGVPAMVAVEEGRTLGLKPGREKAVRERLGLPAMEE